MKVLCAWCEEEGKQALIRNSESGPSGVATHGICHEHEMALLKQIAELARTRKQRGREPVLSGRARGAGAVTVFKNHGELGLPGR
jgi:hypothetical protein